jgi:hypothetical protein
MGKENEEEKVASDGNSQKITSLNLGSKQKIDSKDDLDKIKAFSFMDGSKQAANSSGVSVV